MSPETECIDWYFRVIVDQRKKPGNPQPQGWLGPRAAICWHVFLHHPPCLHTLDSVTSPPICCCQSTDRRSAAVCAALCAREIQEQFKSRFSPCFVFFPPLQARDPILRLLKACSSTNSSSQWYHIDDEHNNRVKNAALMTFLRFITMCCIWTAVRYVGHPGDTEQIHTDEKNQQNTTGCHLMKGLICFTVFTKQGINCISTYSLLRDSSGIEDKTQWRRVTQFRIYEPCVLGAFANLIGAEPDKWRLSFRIS